MKLLTWLDDRTGYRGLMRGALYEHIPGGARWRYVWGSTLIFTFVVQMVTGLFLWMHYSPSSQTAWESVYYIQHQMTGGWLLRGIHHYTAQVMIILLAFHMLQVIIDGAYRAPREVNFWIGLLLLNVVLALSLTGYLLPWDQKGYWATQVATSLLNLVPVIGGGLQRLVVGGPEYGHHTLTRFFALHAGLLPFVMMVLIAAHVYVFRRHGLRHKEPRLAGDSSFWPDQILRDAVACLGVLAFILFLVLRFKLVPGGNEHLGAELTGPADPSEDYSAARPEWYFLFLFQFLKLPFFAGHAEVYGAVVIPGLIMGLLFLMPIIGRWKAGHWFNVGFIVFLAIGMVLLTIMALVEDSGRPHVRLPLLGQLGPMVNVVLLGVMLLAVLVLIPLFTRERSFRFNITTLGLLLLLVLIGVGMVVAGGGATQAGPRVQIYSEINELGQRFRYMLDVQQALLLAVLGALALLFTVVLLRDYPHPGEVALPSAAGAGPDAGPAVVQENGTVEEEAVGDAERMALSPSADHTSAPAPDRISLRRWQRHHRLRLVMLMLVIVGTVFLAAIGVVGGAGKAEFALAVEQAQAEAQRVVELASSPTGIPPQGAIWLLREDPKTHGPKLFAAHCASCHRYDGHDGRGIVPIDHGAYAHGGAANSITLDTLASDQDGYYLASTVRIDTGPGAGQTRQITAYSGSTRTATVDRPWEVIPDSTSHYTITSPQSAPDLKDFASREWIAGMLRPDEVDMIKYFGPHMAAHDGNMVEYVKEDVAEFEPEQQEMLRKATIALSAEANLPAQQQAEAADAALIEEGRTYLSHEDIACTDCHTFHDEKSSKKNIPTLTAYGSEQWLIDFIANPAAPHFYGRKNDRMPAYREQQILDEKQITLLAKWLRGDWYEPGETAGKSESNEVNQISRSHLPSRSTDRAAARGE